VIYLDTSALGALFFRETAASAILETLEKHRTVEFSVSAWTLGEMASVDAIKERTGQIDAKEKAAGLATFDHFVSDSLKRVEVDPGDFRAAAVLLDAPNLALRAGDALHLAIARRLRAALVTLDQRQASAAQHYGIPVMPLV